MCDVDVAPFIEGGEAGRHTRGVRGLSERQRESQRRVVRFACSTQSERADQTVQQLRSVDADVIERRVECEAATDLWYVAQNVFRQYVAREMATTRPTLDRTLSRPDAAGVDPDAVEYDRIQQLPLIYAP